MISNHLIVIGASAGGIDALTHLVEGLPKDFPAAILVVVHFPATSASFLPRILNKAGRLPADHPINQEHLEPGKIYVAQPDTHLLVNDSTVSIGHGPREHGFRPAIDPLFRTAARAQDSHVIGVILSGTMGDGVAGLQAIKRAGGITIVQDPKEAAFSTLPQNAIENVEVDYVLPVKDIAKTLVRLADHEYQPNLEYVAMEQDQENELIQQDKENFVEGNDEDARTVLTCPECGGVLWEMKNGKLLRYRCHEGHIYTIDTLLESQSVELEQALWSAVRMLTERSLLLKRLENQARERGNINSANRFLEHAENVSRQAEIIRSAMENVQPPTVEM
jgi:two-component system chemotaxis response regulator CheB